MASIVGRLRKRAGTERQIAENSRVVADLLQPQMDKFEAREGHNVYAVRTAIDHRNSAKRDCQFADDLTEAADLIEDLVEALEWYAVKVAGCRKVTSEGNEARYALDEDGGKRALAALAKATASPGAGGE